MNDVSLEMLDPAELTPEQTCARIERLTTAMMSFWKDAHGWAPADAAGLLSRSMLDEQASLSSSLCRWLDADSAGDLILAWVNLGVLVEGQLKLLLAVYLDDFKSDSAGMLNDDGKKIYGNRPDKLMLEKLKTFCQTQVWDASDPWHDYVARIQSRRNAIHTFQQKEIGTFEEWRSELTEHLKFVEHVNLLLPYPDDVYVPRSF